MRLYVCRLPKETIMYGEKYGLFSDTSHPKGPKRLRRVQHLDIELLSVSPLIYLSTMTLSCHNVPHWSLFR